MITFKKNINEKTKHYWDTMDKVVDIVKTYPLSKKQGIVDYPNSKIEKDLEKEENI